LYTISTVDLSFKELSGGRGSGGSVAGRVTTTTATSRVRHGDWIPTPLLLPKVVTIRKRERERGGGGKQSISGRW